MRILLCAPGAEDGRSPLWYHVALPFRNAGHDVVAFDARGAVDSSKDDAADLQIEWLFTEFQPHVVIDLSPDDYVAGFVKKHGTNSIRVAAPHLNLSNGATSLSAFVNAELLRTRSSDIAFEATGNTAEVVFVGTASTNRSLILNELTEAGLSVRAFGDGWESKAIAKLFETHRAPYSLELAEVLRSSRYALCLALDDEVAGAATSIETQILQALAAGVTPIAFGDAELNLGAEYAGLVARASSPAEIRELIESHFTVSDQPNKFPSILDDPAIAGSLKPPAVTGVREYQPKVSVLISSYNVAEYLGESIESVLNQTESDFELVVSNDGSPDDSRAVIERYCSDERVKLIDQTNIGQTGRFDFIWNNLVRHARADLLMYIGADDRCRVDRMEKQLTCFAEQPDLDISHTAAELIDNTGQVTSRGAFSIGESYSRENMARALLTYNLVAAPTLMVKKSIYDRIAPWECGFSCDYHYWMKSASSLRYQFIPQYLVQWRNHQKSASTGYDTDVTHNQGLRVLRLERERQTIFDLYPELKRHVDDRVAVAAAYVDMGVRMLARQQIGSMALEEFDRAEAVLGGGHRVITLGKAIAYRYLGENEDASRYLKQANEDYPALLINDATMLSVDQLPDASELSRVPFTVSKSNRKNTWLWDGTNVALRRVMVVVDAGHMANIEPAIAQFIASFSDQDDIELVIPSLEHPMKSMVDAVLAIASSIPGMADGPSVSIDEIDDLNLIPLSRFTAVLDLRRDFPRVALEQSLRNMFAEIRTTIDQEA